MKKYIYIFLLFCIQTKLFSQNPNLIAVNYISGLIKPTTITNCNDARLFVVEQDGRIRIIRNDSLIQTPFLDINPIVNSLGNEQGLLGLAFHPDYKLNGFFYINYTNNSGNTVIARYTVSAVDSNLANSLNGQILMTINQPFNNHNGGDLAFGPDGYLYIPTGDGGSANDPQNRAQNKVEKLGKILRIDVNQPLGYSIPPDNPFINDSIAAKEIWNIGMRNPWKVDFDNLTGDLWIGDVGQNLYEEIDFQKAGLGSGLNYGWRCYEATHAFNTSGCLPQTNYEDPIYEYAHNAGNCSVTGGVIYRGGRYSNLFGHYIFTDFCVPSLRTLKQSGATFNYIQHATVSGAGFTCFGEDYEGEVYAAGQTTGILYKIRDTSDCKPVAWLSANDSIDFCGTTMMLSTPFNSENSYSWKFNGNIITNASSNSLAINQDGIYTVSVINNTTSCTNSDSVVVIFKQPSAQAQIVGLDTAYCSSVQAVPLTLIPSGGVLSGSGISGSDFFPSIAGTGIHVIDYTVTAPNGCSSSLKLVVKVNDCSSLNEYQNLYVSKIYPNPTKEFLNVSLSLKEKGNYSLVITDMVGRVMKSDNISLDFGKQEVTINCANLLDGIYLLKFESKENNSITPFVIIH